MVKVVVTTKALAVVVLCACLASCGGGSAAKPSPSSQGFIPVPAQSQTATRSAGSTATAPIASPSPSTVASVPTPTPIATPNVAASAQASGCQVTPFDKSDPPQVRAQVYPQWYGRGDLWFAPASFYAGSGLQQLASSSVWFQGITPTIVLAKQTPNLTGHLANDPSTVVTTSPGSADLVGAARSDEPAHGLNISLPKPGCWQLSITSGTQKLDVTIWVVPITQRPDYVLLTNMRKSLSAYPPPANCAVTNWNGPSDHGAAYSADYWITGQGMNLDSFMPVFFPTQSGPVYVYGNLPNQPTVTGQLAGDATGVVRSSWIEHASGSGQSGWQGSIIFSNPGCWNVSVTDGSAKVDATVYVYPATCAPANNSTKASPCKPPE